MKILEEIRREIKRLKTENDINWDRKEHYELQDNGDRVCMYLEMIKQNDAKIEALNWVLDE